MLQANHWALQRQLLNKMTGQPATKTPKLAHIVSNHGDRLVKKLAVKKVPVVPNFLHKGPPTSSSVGHLKWVTEGIRVKEEPEVIEIDDNTDTGIGLTYDQSDEGLSCTDMEKEQALIKKYFNLPSNQDVALSDEQLLQCYLVGKSAAENFISKFVISTMLIVFVYKTSFFPSKTIPKIWSHLNPIALRKAKTVCKWVNLLQNFIFAKGGNTFFLVPIFIYRENSHNK